MPCFPRLQLTRSSFKSPEGGYVCAATRRTNLAFQPDLATRLTLAELTGDLAGQFLVCNIGNRLFVYPATAVDKASWAGTEQGRASSWLLRALCFLLFLNLLAVPRWSTLVGSTHCGCCPWRFYQCSAALHCAAMQDAAAVVHFAQPGANATPCYPTCHSHAQTQDDYDLLVGLNTGEGASAAGLASGWMSLLRELLALASVYNGDAKATAVLPSSFTAGP